MLFRGAGWAGVLGGQVYGASDRWAAYPARDPVSPDDLGATILNALGIDPAIEIVDAIGRPLRINTGTSSRAVVWLTHALVDACRIRRRGTCRLISPSGISRHAEEIVAERQSISDRCNNDGYAPLECGSLLPLSYRGARPRAAMAVD